MSLPLSFSRRRHLSLMLASEAAECGLACIAMIARYHGHDVDLNGLRQRFALSLSGMSLRNLIELANQLGLSSRPLRAELSALAKVRTPAILHWDLNHFVVLHSMTGRKAVIYDPALGIRKLPLAEVSKHFTGVVLELTPSSSFQPVRASAPIRLSSLWSQITGLGPAIIQVIVLSAALQIATFAAPFQIQLVVDEALYHDDRELLLVIALAFGALAVVQAAIEALRGWVLKVFGFLLSFQIVGNLVRHMMRLPADFFEKRHVGDIFSRIGAVQPIQDAITRGLVAVIIDGIMAFVAAGILFFYSVLLAAIVIAAVLLHLAISLALLPGMRHRMQEEILAHAKEQSHLMETIRAATTIKLMGREPERESAWRNLYADVTNAGISVGKYQITTSAVQTLITSLVYVIIVYIAGRLVLSGEGFSVGMLFAFLSFRQTFNDRAIGFVNQIIQFRLLGLHLDRLADIVTTVSEPDAATQSLDVKGAIKVTQVSFRYGATDQPVLEDISFEVRPGDFIAITGPSGGGKTTLLKLLLGLHPPSAGSIELDGRKADPQIWRTWRKRVGFVAQDDRLLSGTIADNIGFFDPDLDMTRVQDSAKAAQVHDDIMRAPMQYLGLIGDMGSTLSGGQRQRVLLARALYTNPSVLFLDEGTANLDEETEEIIAQLVERMPITRIVVAHRPALIRRARRVFLIKDHKLMEVRSDDAKAAKTAVETVPLAPAASSIADVPVARSEGFPTDRAAGEPLPTGSPSGQVQPDRVPTEPPLEPSRRQKAPILRERSAANESIALEPVPVRSRRTLAIAAAILIPATPIGLFYAMHGVLFRPDAAPQVEPAKPPPLPQAQPIATPPERVAQSQPAAVPAPPTVEAGGAGVEPVFPVPDRPNEHPVPVPPSEALTPAPPPEPVEKSARAVATPRIVSGTLAATARKSFRDCEKCPELIELPSGGLEMGSSDDALQRPVHRVVVAPFALGRFPVTIGEWHLCVEALACTYQPKGDDDEPVRNLSWMDTQQYVGWLTRLTKLKYRLPTEAEWEFAARAQTTTRFWWGDQFLPTMANCKGCGERITATGPAKVGGFPSNPFGLYDMTGSVWQWVSDCWHPDYTGAPTDGSSWEVPNCSEKVIRGGSWMNEASYLRTTTRFHYDSDVRYPANGFRVARPL